MRASQESFYGIQVMWALARRDPAQPALLEELAASRGLPRNFLAKILQKLVRGGLITSYRGHQRGYALAVAPERITVKEILLITEGPELFDHCFFRARRCFRNSTCPLHTAALSARTELEARLRALTLADLARESCP